MSVSITAADLSAPDFIALINTHAELMLDLSPPGSCHFLPIDGLKTPDVTVWALREGSDLVGSGALKHLSDSHGEIKSMHTLARHRGKGLAQTMLDHIIAEALRRGYTRLSLETGSSSGFEAARRLYERNGFSLCGPFGDYSEDPHSVFMTRAFS
ncbi:MAG: GNAT family N-acetyltransferase [Henriciella sp.]|nr:GNAT family N-acetyltransferase [Henriciella sp.]